MKKQAGFTLIELIMVIVILGILSAFALPRFADLSGNAETAKLNGALGAIKAASSIAHAACLADADCATNAAGETVNLDGAANLDIDFGYPGADDNSSGIVDATDLSGFVLARSADVDGTDGATTIAGLIIVNNGNDDEACVFYIPAQNATTAPDIGTATYNTEGTANDITDDTCD